MGPASHSVSQRCELFGYSTYFADVAWYVAMRSLPCHLGSFQLVRLTRNWTQDPRKRYACWVIVHTTGPEGKLEIFAWIKVFCLHPSQGSKDTEKQIEDIVNSKVQCHL